MSGTAAVASAAVGPAAEGGALFMTSPMSTSPSLPESFCRNSCGRAAGTAALSAEAPGGARKGFRL